MSDLRVISPILHDQVRYEVGDLMDPSILSEGQAEALIVAGALEVVDDEPTQESAAETPAQSAPEATPVADEPETAPETPAEEPEQNEQNEQTADPAPEA